MASLAYVDKRRDPAGWARDLGVSRAAVVVYLSGDVIDLHVDSFIWNRILGYDLTARHDLGPLGGMFMSQVDLPRMREACVTGATWIISTNPLRSAEGRARAFVNNQRRLREILSSVPGEVAVVRTVAEYRRARAAGKHGAFMGIQGGNALDRDLDALDLIEDDLILRITLVHLSTSRIGGTSSPLGGIGGSEAGGLTDFGKAYVRRLNEKKIFVDLAHIHPKGFWDAVAVHDKAQPLLVTHTGVSGVFPHWRNLDDDQLRAVADTGGTIGVMFHGDFLGPTRFGWKAEAIVEHLDHVVKTVGEDHASLGSDFDGAILPPADMPSCLELPRLVELMLRKGWREERVRKVLGGNFLRVVEVLRG